DQTFAQAKLSTASGATATFGGSPRFVLENVSLDLGTFISDFAGPVLDKVKQVIAPLDPILEILQSEIPVISDLGTPVTLLDLAEQFGGKKFDRGFIDAVIAVKSVIDSIPTGNESIMFSFGDFVIMDGSGKNDLRDESKSLADTDTTADPSFNVDQALNNASGGTPQGKLKSKGFINRLRGLNGFSVPLISNPSSIFGLITGKTVDLLYYDMPHLNLPFQYAQSFPLFPIPGSIRFAGRASVSVNVGFGFDSSGIEEFKISDDPLDIFNGFFVKDNPGNELSFEIEIGAGLAAGVAGFVETGVEGGLFAQVGFDLADVNEDGKLRVEEIGERLDMGAHCIFDTSGSIGAYLDWFFQVSVLGFLVVDERGELARQELAGFDVVCVPETPPRLADPAGGVLTLNMGDRAAARGTGDLADATVMLDGEGLPIVDAQGNLVLRGERFEIDQRTIDGEERIVISFNGVEEKEEVLVDGNTERVTYSYPVSSLTKIVAAGGAGNDTIIVRAGVTLPLEIDGGTGDDVINVLSNDPATAPNTIINGGPGNDTIITGAGIDIINGGGGKDLIRSGAGNDTVDGGSGSDSIRGEDGDDVLRGGDENLLISHSGDGGGFTLTFDGEKTNGIAYNAQQWMVEYAIEGVPGINDVTVTGAGTSGNPWNVQFVDPPNNILPTFDDSSLTGGALKVAIAGDRISGGPGNDLIVGGKGADTLLGDEDDDWIEGGPDADRILGHGGNDTLLGAAGNDDLTGGAGVDVVIGDAGNDAIRWTGQRDETIVDMLGVESIVQVDDGVDAFISAGDGVDTYFFTASAGADAIAIRAATTPGSWTGTRPGGTTPLTVNQPVTGVSFEVGGLTNLATEVESVSIDAGDGGDTLDLQDLRGTGVANIEVNAGLKPVPEELREVTDDDGQPELWLIENDAGAMVPAVDEDGVALTDGDGSAKFYPVGEPILGTEGEPETYAGGEPKFYLGNEFVLGADGLPETYDGSEPVLAFGGERVYDARGIPQFDGAGETTSTRTVFYVEQTEAGPVRRSRIETVYSYGTPKVHAAGEHRRDVDGNLMYHQAGTNKLHRAGDPIPGETFAAGEAKLRRANEPILDANGRQRFNGTGFARVDEHGRRLVKANGEANSVVVAAGPSVEDSAADTITIHGGQATVIGDHRLDADHFTADTLGIGVNVRRTVGTQSMTYSINHSVRATGDRLIINAHDGDDVLDASAVVRDFLAVDLIGEAGNDILSGTLFDDRIYGGTGSDTLSGNAGQDQFFDSSTSGDIDTLIERQNVDMTLTGNLLFAGKLRKKDGGPLVSQKEKYGLEGELDKQYESLNELADHYAASYLEPALDADHPTQVESLLDGGTPIFERAELNGTGQTLQVARRKVTSADNILVLNDQDGFVHVGDSPIAVTPWVGSVAMDNGENLFNQNPEFYIVNLAGNRARVDINDSGSSGIDVLIAYGSPENDTVTLDAENGPDGRRRGLIEVGAGVSDPDGDQITYSSIKQVTIDTRSGDDTVTSHDNMVLTVINLGPGDDTATVGEVTLVPNPDDRSIEFPDGFPVADLPNSTKGNSAIMVINGDSDDDYFEVNRNAAPLYLHGGDHDDTFVINSFAIQAEGKEIANLTNAFGGSGNNRYEYVENAPVFINGGSGTDTVVINGTPRGDTFVVTANSVAGAGRVTYFTEIERLEINAAGGNDEIYVLGSSPDVEMILRGGSGDDKIHLGGDHPVLVFKPPEFTFQPPDVTVYQSVDPLPESVAPRSGARTTDLFSNIIFGAEVRWGIARNEVNASLEALLEQHKSRELPGAPLVGGVAVDDIVRRGVNNSYVDLLIDLTFASMQWGPTWGGLLSLIPYISYSFVVPRIDYLAPQPPNESTRPGTPITVIPPAFAYKVPRKFDVSGIQGKVTIDGGTTFEKDGDQVIVHNQEGEPTTVDKLTGTTLEGLTASSVEYGNLEHIELRLAAADKDVFTIESTHAGTTRLVLGGGDDIVNVQSIQGDTEILGGAGNDTVNVSEGDNPSVDGINARLVFDGGADIQEVVTPRPYSIPAGIKVPEVLVNTEPATGEEGDECFTDAKGDELCFGDYETAPAVFNVEGNLWANVVLLKDGYIVEHLVQRTLNDVPISQGGVPLWIDFDPTNPNSVETIIARDKPKEYHDSDGNLLYRTTPLLITANASTPLQIFDVTEERKFFAGTDRLKVDNSGVSDNAIGVVATYNRGVDTFDPTSGQPIFHNANELAFGLDGQPVLHQPGDPVVYLGHEQVIDGDGNVVTNVLGDPILRTPGERKFYLGTEPVLGGQIKVTKVGQQFEIVRDADGLPEIYPGSGPVLNPDGSPMLHQLGEPKFYLGGEPRRHTSLDPVQELKTFQRLTGLDMVGGQIDFRDLDEIEISLGSGDDTLTIHNIQSVGMTTVNAGAGSDVIRIDRDGINSDGSATVTINGQMGDGDQLDVFTAPGAANGATTWHVTGENSGRVETDVLSTLLTFESIESFVGGDAAGDTFIFADGASVSTLLDGRDGADTVDFSASTSPVVIDRGRETIGTASFANIEHAIGGNASDTLIGEDLTNDWQITGTNQGSIESIGGDPLLTFVRFENLTGGDAADRFAIAAGASVSGVVDGGGHADDLLDYSGWTIRVEADLAAGSASATGGVIRTEHVTGGSGPDQLLGDEQPNQLVGGPGDDLLDGRRGDDLMIGNFGDDRLLGGEGRDLMFGGEMFGLASNYEFGTTDFRLPPQFFETERKYSSDPRYYGRLPSTDDPFDLFQFFFYSPSHISRERYVPPQISPAITRGQSVEGDFADGADTLQGGIGMDVLFGGGDADTLYGDNVTESANDGGDYIDAGGGNDLTVVGGGGEDVILGGTGNDFIDGGSGIDQLYGHDGDDVLIAGPGSPDPLNPLLLRQAGQRLFGGEGRDKLIGYSAADQGESVDAGDQLFGGPGGDQIFGGLRMDVIVAGGGNDAVFGDGDSNPPGIDITLDGGGDRIWGDGGNDELRGGGGPDTIFGGLGTDLIDGQGGNDKQYGGSGIDIFLLSTDASPVQNDTIDGHFGNTTEGDRADDNATDILQIDGTSGDDTILIGSRNGQATVLYRGTPIPVQMLDAAGTPLVEQFRISGLAGNDTIGFYTDDIVIAGVPLPTLPDAFTTIDLDALGERSRDFVGVFDGNSGDDLLLGSAGRDRMDGGIGSDTLFGFGGGDRLWGDGGEGRARDRDALYAGQGDDDLIGGQGDNRLYAWSFDPAPGLFGVLVDNETGQLVDDDLHRLHRINNVPVDAKDEPVLIGFTLTAAGTAGQSIAIENLPAGRAVSYSLRRDGETVEVATGVSTGSSLSINIAGLAEGTYRLQLADATDSGGESFQPFAFDLVSTLDPVQTRVVDRDMVRLETTGLNRMLGSLRDDSLFGGTTLDFMYGNGGNDVLYRSNGTTFESMDGGLAGGEWKEYAKESDQVWYIGGSNANDQIAVNFVTEPGLLADHHLITRLTDNNGNFSFSAQVRLDFSAIDGEGNEVWDTSDDVLDLDQLLADPATRQQTLEQLDLSETELINNLLPPEGDFLVILIDALDGNDTITVGPTVQKSVWVDAGAGDDVVKIQSGNAILVDKTESSIGATGLKSRNDIPAQAFNLLTPRRNSLLGPPVNAAFDETELVSGQIRFSGLSIDSPTDVDWYTFRLTEMPNPGGKIELASGSPIDDLGLKIYEVDPLATDDPLNKDNIILVATGTTAGNRGEVSLGGLAAGTTYYLEVASPNIVPTVYDLGFNVDNQALGTDEFLPEISLSLREDIVRRDVILGGDGNDILQGGGGEDWIFGNAGNDVLTGGKDRQASDLLFGGDGDDTFQIIPDALPLLGNQPNSQFDPATETYIPTFSEQYIGGDGNDRVLFLGGDLDRRGNPVPDYAAMRYNTGLHRYELSSLVWDIGTQEYRYDDTNTNGTQDAGEAFEQQFQFFQTRDVESFTIDTRGGNDVVRLDSEFQFLPLMGNPLMPDTSQAGLYEEWGMDLGDFEQGAGLPLTILGGAGDDFLFGSPTSDVIGGGPGNDLIVGGPGSDQIDGGGNNDTIFGNELGATTTDPYPYFPLQASLGLPERAVFDLAIPLQTTTTVVRRGGVDLNETTTVTTPVNVPAGAIAYFSFDDSANVGDNSVAGGPDATPTGVAFDAGGVSGGAAAFAGQSSVLSIASGGINAGSDWTAAAWFKGLIATTNHNTLFHAFDHPVIVKANGNQLGNWDNTTGRTGDDRFRASGYDLVPSASATNWQHLVAVGRDGGTHFYIDGIYVGFADTQAVGQFDRIGNVSSTQQFAQLLDEVYIYDRALDGGEIRDLYDSVTISQRDAVQITGVEDNAFGLQGSEGDQIDTLESFGDVNDDGVEDFIARGTSKSYVLFGPVSLTDLEDIETYAEVIIDHETLGRPAEGMGDINADGIRDYAFVTSTSEDLVVRVILGTVEVTERNWNGDYWDNQLASNRRTIELQHAYLGTGSGIDNIGLHVLPFFGDMSGSREYSDILVYSETTSGVYQILDGSYMTGLFYSGELLTQSTSTPMGIFDRSGDIIHKESSSETGIRVVDSLTAPGSTHVLVKGTTVDTTIDAAPRKLEITGSRAIPFITSEITVLRSFFHEQFFTLFVTPQSSQTPAVRFQEIEHQFRDAFATDSGFADRYRVSSTAGSLTFESVERGPNAAGLVLFEDVVTRPLGLDSGAVVSIPGDSQIKDFIVGTKSVTLVQDSVGLDVEFTINAPGGAGVFNITINSATTYQNLRATIEAQLNANLNPDTSSLYDVQYVSGDRLFIARDGNDVHITDFESVNSYPLISTDIVGMPSQTLTTETGTTFLTPRSRVTGSIVYDVDNTASGTTPFPDQVKVVNDLNLDGLNDIGFIDSLGHLSVVYGTPTLDMSFPSQPDFTITSTGTVIDAASGDFNGDYKVDLAVGYELPSGENEIAIFFNVGGHMATSGSTLDVLSADTTITSAADDEFATHVSALQLNGGLIDDLIIGSQPAFNTLEDDVVPDGGRLSVVYGSEPKVMLDLPASDEITVLENFSVAGSGSFVADRGTGRSEVFDNGGDPFALAAGEEKWFQFTTLGDGKAGDVIRLRGGVMADLVDADGMVLKASQTIFDLRTQEAGTYFLRVYRQDVSDATADSFGPADIIVDTLMDENDGNTADTANLIASPGGSGISLREAILASNNTAGAQIIGFAPGMRGSIDLAASLGEIRISESVTIAGPGADAITIDAGQNDYRIFHIFDGDQSVDQTVVIDGLTLTGGNVVAGQGGAIRNLEALTISNSRIVDNSASGNGGGIFSAVGPLTVHASTISENVSNATGGGIRSVDAELTVTDSTFFSNIARFGGGGIFNLRNALSIDNSTFSQNAAGTNGGGVFTDQNNGNLVEIQNSTFTLNRSDNTGNGNGLGGGIRAHNANTIVLHNTIVAGNTNGLQQTADDYSGAADSASSFNLIGIAGSLTGITHGSQGNQIGTISLPIDAMLGGLADNGGATFTHVPDVSSPAIDSGNTTAIVDQRGRSRPFDGDLNGVAAADIGAVEVDKAFSIVFDAPIRGQTHESSAHPDRDLIRGGDGDDFIVGNTGLDRIFGDSGNDTFRAEPVEIRDLQSFEAPASSLPPISQLSFENLEPTLDPIVIDADAVIAPGVVGLYAAIARQLGYPVTTSPSGTPLLHHDIRASELAQLRELDASSSEIADLKTLQFTTNLEVLNLSDNPLGDASLVPITGINHLRSLDLSQTNVIPTSQTTLDTIQSLETLSSLYLPIDTGRFPGAIVEDFETAPIGIDPLPGWTYETSFFAGRVEIESRLGGRSLHIEPNSSTLTRGEATWTVDLSSLTNPTISFQHVKRSGESDSPFSGPFTNSANADGVAVSSNGVDWIPIYSPSSALGVLETVEVNLKNISGFTPGVDSQIRFQQYGRDTSTFGISQKNRGRNYDSIQIWDSRVELIPDQNLSVVEGETANVSAQSSQSWQVLAPSGTVVGSGTGPTVSFPVEDDGIHVVQANHGGTFRDWFPVFARNADPSLSVPAISGLHEGDTFLVGPDTGTTDHRRTITGGGVALGEIVVTDPGAADVPDLVVAASITDPAGQTTSLVRNALEFADDALEVSHRALDGAGSFTTSFWVDVEDTPTEQTILSGANDAETNAIEITLTGNSLLTARINGEEISFPPPVLSAGYHFFALVRDLEPGKESLTLYIDDVHIFTETLPVASKRPLSIDSGGLMLGQDQGFVGGAFDSSTALHGSIDEFAVWNRALTKDEIDKVFAGDIATNDSSLRLYLPFDEGAGSVVADRGPLGLDASLINDFSYTKQVSENHPRLYYSFDEVAGASQARNLGSLGGQYDASLPANVSVGNTGQVGGAVEFGSDASGISLSRPLSDGLAGPDQSFTLELWFNADSLPTPASAIYSLFTGIHSNGNSGFGLELDSNGKLRVLHRDLQLHDTDFLTSAAVSPGTWNHVVVITENQSVRLFLNGVLAPLVARTPATGDNVNSIATPVDFPVTLSIGALLPSQPARAFDGSIDEFALYDYALSGDDVARHFQVASQTNFPGSPSFTNDVHVSLQTAYTLIDDGAYTLTVTASDGDGGFDRSVTRFDVLNTPPYRPTISAPVPGPHYTGVPIELS
uniref:LamG-like jellyroll fold domain-containing protein n=1 Tax=Stieleria sp. TaxID=2795976 RepID=UPI00356A9D5F